MPTNKEILKKPRAIIIDDNPLSYISYLEDKDITHKESVLNEMLNEARADERKHAYENYAKEQRRILAREWEQKIRADQERKDRDKQRAWATKEFDKISFAFEKEIRADERAKLKHESIEAYDKEPQPEVWGISGQNV